MPILLMLGTRAPALIPAAKIFSRRRAQERYNRIVRIASALILLTYSSFVAVCFDISH